MSPEDANRYGQGRGFARLRLRREEECRRPPGAGLTEALNREESGLHTVVGVPKEIKNMETR